MKVTWVGKNVLQISRGDKIQVLSGFGSPESGQIEATRIRDQKTGNYFESDIYKIATPRNPIDFTPPIVGYVKFVHRISGEPVVFELDDTAPPIVSAMLQECERFVDPKLYKRCKDKDYHDVVGNAFPILEDRIREKTGLDPSICGQPLMNKAFSPSNGILTLGDTASEHEGLYLLFKGAIGFLRNPESHSLIDEETNIESLELMLMIDLLLRFVDKAKPRS